MFQNNYLVIVPGIILAFILYTLSHGLNNIIGIESDTQQLQFALEPTR